MDDYISMLFSYHDKDVILHGSKLLQDKISNEQINCINQIDISTSSKYINSDLRRKVFGPNFEFMTISPNDFFDTSIYLYYDSMMDTVAINPTTTPTYFDEGFEGMDVANTLQIYHGSDYRGVTTTTTTGNLQEFVQAYQSMYDSTVLVQSGTGFGDIGGLFENNGFLGAFGALKRDTTELPGFIMRILNKLLSLNLYYEHSRVAFSRYFEKIGY